MQAAQHQPGLVNQAAEILRLRAGKEVDRLTIASLQVENGTLKQRLAEVKRQLGLNSSNSSKPPSSGGQRNPPAQGRTKRTRGRSGKRSGG